MLEKKDLEMIAEIMKELVHPISEDINKLHKDVQVLQKDVHDVQKDVQEVQLTLENETNRNIKVIAEGHLDLSRKLDDALKVENEKEMLLIRVTSLENEIRRLRAKIEEIA